jgi:hypothetical protein
MSRLAYGGKRHGHRNQGSGRPRLNVKLATKFAEALSHSCKADAKIGPFSLEIF